MFRYTCWFISGLWHTAVTALWNPKAVRDSWRQGWRRHKLNEAIKERNTAELTTAFKAYPTASGVIDACASSLTDSRWRQCLIKAGLYVALGAGMLLLPIFAPHVAWRHFRIGLDRARARRECVRRMEANAINN